jgi:GT2 family glycosyltransferase
MLPALVQALHAQTRAVGRIIGVDTGSRDRSGAVLAELIGQDSVFGMERATGFGQAVWGALRRAPARRPDDSVEWVWLLHDDCEPAPETLERLLRAASRDRSVVVLGPKVLDGSDHRVLRETGISIDRAGRRVTGIDTGEIDQGQHDHNRAVLAVGSAGMLVRRDVWDQLGGFDTHLRMFRDDVDFCWRVHAAGYRVQVVTDAVLYHRELTARKGRRPEGVSARRLDRRNALYVLAVNLPFLPMLTTLAGCVAGTLLRAAYFLLTKQVDRALDQLSALSELVLHPMRIWRARRRRAAGRGQGYSAVRMFIPRGRPMRRLGESIASVLSPQGASGMHHATDGSDGEDDQFIEPRSVLRRIMASPGVQLVAALLLIALVAERRLLGASVLGGGALVPAWGGASALWSEYLAGFHAVGIGSAASTPPYVAVVAALATILGGQGWLAVSVLLLGSVPLAGLTAYLAAGRLRVTPVARVWMAMAYALLPVAMGAVAAGRLGTATVFILAPLLARVTARMLTAPPRAARRAAWATGLLTAIAAAFVPLVWVIVAGLVLVLLALRRWVWPMSLLNAVIVIAAPFLVLFPWSLRLLTSPSGFLLEAGLTREGLSAASLRPQSLLLLHPGGPGLPPLWVTAGLALALVSLGLSRHAGLVVAGWSVAVAGFAAALALSRSTVVPDGGGSPVSAWPGAALAIAAVGLLIAAAPAADWLAGGLRAAASGARPADAPPRAVAILALIAAAAGPVVAAGSWVSQGVRGPVATVSSPVLPAYVAASSASGTRYRTLVLRRDGGVLTYYVLRQGDPTLGEPELARYAPAEQGLSRQVAALTAPNGADSGDPGQVLAEFDIRWVVVPSPVDQALAQRLNSAVGIVPVSSAPAYDLWQVTGPVGRVRVLGADGTVSVLPSQEIGASAVRAPAAGGTLVLAEPAGGWSATLGGRPLTAVAKPFDGWAQQFTLPAGGGELVVGRDNIARNVSLLAEVIVFLAVCVLALPGKRADPAEEAATLAALPAARRGRQPGHSRRAQEPGNNGPDAAERAVRTAGARRGKRAEALNRIPRRRVASSPRIDAVTEGGAKGTSRVSVLDDAPGHEEALDSAQVAKTSTAAWRAPPAPFAPGGTPGRAGRPGPAGSSGAPWETAGRGAIASEAAGQPGRPPGHDSGANWSEVMVERDSGPWRAVPGGRPASANDGWRTDSGSFRRDPGPGSGSAGAWGTGLDWDSGPGAGPADSSGPDRAWPASHGRADRSTGSQPWESLAAPRDPAETDGNGANKNGADRNGADRNGADRRGTAPQLTAAQPAGGHAPDGKPAERHSHRAPGRHGRPGRRMWDRPGKDKDKDA